MATLASIINEGLEKSRDPSLKRVRERILMGAGTAYRVLGIMKRNPGLGADKIAELVEVTPTTVRYYARLVGHVWDEDELNEAQDTHGVEELGVPPLVFEGED